MGFDRCVQADCPITVPYGPSASTQNQALAVHMFLFAAVLGKENTYLPACSRLFVIILPTTCCSLAVGKSTHIFINVKSHIVGEKKTTKKQDKQEVLDIPGQSSNYAVLSELCRQNRHQKCFCFFTNVQSLQQQCYHLVSQQPPLSLTVSHGISNDLYLALVSSSCFRDVAGLHIKYNHV